MGFIEGSTPVGIDAAVRLPPFVNFGSYNIAAYGHLRVVAMRIDPCFGSLDPDPSGAGCTAQLRLVLQDVRWIPDGEAAVFEIPTLATPDVGGAIAQGIGFSDFGTAVQPTTTTSNDDYSAIYNASEISLPPSSKIQAALERSRARRESQRQLSGYDRLRTLPPGNPDCACHLVQ